MAKKALLVYGEANIGEDVEFFSRECQKDILRMKEVFENQNYSLRIMSFDELYNMPWEKFPDCSVFYYTGHGNAGTIGSERLVKTEDLLERISVPNERNLAIFDSCSPNYDFPDGFNMDIFYTPLGNFNKSLSKVIYDLVIYRGIELKKIDEETFSRFAYNFVKVNSGKDVVLNNSLLSA